MSDVLVDSSVWIDFLRGDAKTVGRVDRLLEDDRVATTPMILAEVVSWAKTRAELERLRTRMAAPASLPEPPNLWASVAEVRFALARRGTQATLVDLAIALTAAAAAHRLLTRDRDFAPIARVVPLDLDLY